MSICVSTLLVLLGIVIRLLETAPYGVEDERGFHIREEK